MVNFLSMWWHICFAFTRPGFGRIYTPSNFISLVGSWLGLMATLHAEHEVGFSVDVFFSYIPSLSMAINDVTSKCVIR